MVAYKVARFRPDIIGGTPLSGENPVLNSPGTNILRYPRSELDQSAIDRFEGIVSRFSDCVAVATDSGTVAYATESDRSFA